MSNKLANLIFQLDPLIDNKLQLSVIGFNFGIVQKLYSQEESVLMLTILPTFPVKLEIGK